MMKYHIKEETWKVIHYNLSQKKGLHSRNEAKLRKFIEAIWYITRSGCQWRLLPEFYGNWRSIHRRFKRWCVSGIWAELMENVSSPDKEAVMIDATIVRSHACSGGYKKNSQFEEA